MNQTEAARIYEMNKDNFSVGWVEEIPNIHRFILAARPRTRLTYFVGFDLSDTIMSRKVARMMYDYALKGLVYLFRNRWEHDRKFFKYFAIKASQPPNKELVPLATVVGVTGNGSEKGTSEVGRYVSRDIRRRNAGLSSSDDRQHGDSESGERRLQDSPDSSTSGVVAPSAELSRESNSRPILALRTE